MCVYTGLPTSGLVFDRGVFVIVWRLVLFLPTTAMSYGLLCLAMAYFTHLMGESVLQVSSVDPGWNQMMMMVVVVVGRMKI